MNSNNIFTKRWIGIDGKVVITMLVTLFLLTGFLGYTITKTNQEIPCNPFDILVFGQKNIENKTYAAGDQVLFRVLAGMNDKVTWDFGDNSPGTEGVGTRHLFAEEKIFTVTATLNGRCTSSINIHIKQKENNIIDDSGKIVNYIIGDSEALANEPVTFTTPIEATSYRWSINRSGYPVKNSKDATFTFKTSGTYNVKLVVNGDRKNEHVFTIYIKPIEKLIDDDAPIEISPIAGGEKPTVESDEKKPSDISTNVDADKPESPPVTNKYVFTSDVNLKDYLQSFLCGKMSLQSLQPYFCDINSTAVTITEERKVTSTTLANLCSALKCRRDARILSISEVTRNGNCVTGFLINVEKTKQKKVCPDN